MKLSISAASYVGCVRKNNEDMILVNDKFIRNGKYWTMADTDNADRYLIALADGMGGHSSGEVASSEVLHNLQFYYGDLPSGLSTSDFNEAIFEWLNSINNIIDSKGREEPRYLGMGTTLVGFAYYHGLYFWMNCGDSRIYRLHEGHLTQLSTDHSLSSLLGEVGHSSIVTNCIGGGCKDNYIDIVECTADVQPGDCFILCSDGLSDMIGDGDIAHLLTAGAEAEQLCQAAEKAGGIDNVSAAVIRVQ